MENTAALSKKYIINYGLVLGIVMVLFGVIVYVTDSMQNKLIASFSYVILIGIISYGIYAYKNENNGFLSLTEAFKIGIGIAVIGGIIAALWTYILMNFIEPNLMSQIMEAQMEKMAEDNPTMTEAQIENAMAIAEKFATPFVTITMTLIGNLFFGFVISLIAGLIMKKEA